MNSLELSIEPLEPRTMLTTFVVDGGGGQDFETIQEAIDAAQSHHGRDKIVILDGTYTENLVIEDDDALTLEGVGDVRIEAADAGQDVITIFGSDKIKMRDLIVTGGQDGIDAEATKSLELKNVSAIDNSDEGLQAENIDDKVKIIGGSFSNNGSDGIKVALAKKVEIRDVDVNDNAGNGVLAEAIADKVKIKRGNYSRNGNDGIKVGSDDVLFGAKKVHIEDVFTNDNGTSLFTGDGIDLEVILDSIKVSKVTATGNQDEGLEVDDSGKVEVKKSTFSFNLDEGIDIDDSDEIAIRDIVVIGNGGSGLQIEANDDGDDFTFIKKIKIQKSTFSGNGLDGIQIIEENGTFIEKVELKNITTTENTESGLEISISGQLKLRNIDSDDNGEPDILP